MDFAGIIEVIGNRGRACIDFGESIDAENAPLAAVKNALKSPLLIEDIGQAKKALLVFVGRIEFLSMMNANEESTFLADELRQSENIWDWVLLQVKDDDTDADGVAAFVLATDFKK